ncbi:MAG: hypothetical protein ACLFQ8_00515 [Candidatus Aenigmatarchaeota archaeon]
MKKLLGLILGIAAFIGFSETSYAYISGSNTRAHVLMSTGEIVLSSILLFLVNLLITIIVISVLVKMFCKWNTKKIIVLSLTTATGFLFFDLLTFFSLTRSGMEGHSISIFYQVFRTLIVVAVVYGLEKLYLKFTEDGGIKKALVFAVSAAFIINSVAFTGLYYYGGMDTLLPGIPEPKNGRRDKSTATTEDVLVIENEEISPSPVKANDVFDFSFHLTNINKREKAENVEVRLYETDMCDLHDDSAEGLSDVVIFEEATRMIKWNLKAPNEDELGLMEDTCSLEYYVKYDFGTQGHADLYAMDENVSEDDEIAQVSPSTEKGKGPLKIEIEFGGPQPFRKGSTIPFKVRLRNVGEGVVEYITPEDLIINISYDDDENQINENYLYQEDEWETGCRLPVGEVDENIPFIDDTSPPIACRLYFHEGNEDKDYGTYFEEPLSEFNIEVSVENYTYKLTSKKSVEIETSSN